MDLDLVGFCFRLDFSDFRRIWFFRFFLDLDLDGFFLDLDLFGFSSDLVFSFQSGLDLKRYFQITFNKLRKKLTDTGF